MCRVGKNHVFLPTADEVMFAESALWRFQPNGLFLPEQPFQLGFRAVDFGDVGRGIRARARLEVIAEIRLGLVTDFLGGGLAAMLRYPRVVFNTHLADVQLGAARRTLIQPPQRQTQVRQ